MSNFLTIILGIIAILVVWSITFSIDMAYYKDTGIKPKLLWFMGIK